MKFDFHFGTRARPIGILNEADWKRLAPDWKQVHETRIVEITEAKQICGEVDGLWTRVLDLPIAVVTADCVPVVLFNSKVGAIAVLHAGWRGVEKKIVDNFFASLPDEFKDPRDWQAKLGPSIRPCCYEVDEGLIEKFYARFPDLTQKLVSPTPRRLDLSAILGESLRKLEVEKIETHADCTACTVDSHQTLKYFSYRKGDRNSRQYALAILSSSSS